MTIFELIEDLRDYGSVKDNIAIQSRLDMIEHKVRKMECELSNYRKAVEYYYINNTEENKCYYSGQEGALKFIADITDDYDNATSTQDLYNLIDEVRHEALKALTHKEKYNVKNYKL